ncbi:hypothetical protein DL93DRAFT_2203037 [Clavulina sp. PMI_390]|nr:hypothetical protein DL93DRAFT_2203037 [Clavulina sp. PMI_390]
MSYTWAAGLQPGLTVQDAAMPQAAPGYSYNYPRSAQTSPYAQPVMLPTPPVAVSPLPAGPVWLPVGLSPNTQPMQLPSPSGRPRRLSQAPPAGPVLIDILHPPTRRLGHMSTQPHLLYDIRDFPQKALLNSNRPMLLPDAHALAAVTNPPTAQLKIISKAFPWEIDVESEDPSVAVTVGDVIVAIHETLHKHITNSEWWIVTEQVRDKVTAQYIKNCERSSAGNPRRFEIEKPREKSGGLMRVDWLLADIVMRGIERDEEFINQRIRDPETRAVTWCLVTGPK